MIEVKEEKSKDMDRALQKEGQRLLKATSSYVLMDERGRALSSKGFASFLMRSASWDFVLGGAYGVSDDVRAGAGDTLSLSPMTLPHELARVLFLEQLYRAVTINAKRRYHH